MHNKATYKHFVTFVFCLFCILLQLHYVLFGYLLKLDFKLKQVVAELSQAQIDLCRGLKKFGHGGWAMGNMF